MTQSMSHAFWTIVSVDSFTFLVVGSLVFGCCFFLTAFMKRPGLAALFAPVLAFSGLSANYVARTAWVLPTGDKDTNVALISAVGVFAALVVMLTGVIFAIMLEERKARKIEGRNIVASSPRA